MLKLIVTEQEWKLGVEGEAYVMASDCEVVALFREREFCVFVSGGCALTQREFCTLVSGGCATFEGSALNLGTILFS